MEMIEEYKSKNLRNVLMTGLNNRLLANLQQKITESKSAASLSSRLPHPTVEEQKTSSEDGTRQTRHESKESNAVTGSQVTLNSLLDMGAKKDKARKLSTIQKEEVGMLRPATTKYKSAFFDMATNSEENDNSSRQIFSPKPMVGRVSVEEVDEILEVDDDRPEAQIES